MLAPALRLDMALYSTSMSYGLALPIVALPVVCNGVVKYAWLGLPGGHVRCPAPGNRQPYIDIATET